MKLINKLIKLALLWAARRLCAAIIPADHFGWQKLGEWQPDVGHPVEYGRWRFSDQETERFFAHNRWLDQTAAALRARAAMEGE